MALTFSIFKNDIIETVFRGRVNGQVTMSLFHHQYTSDIALVDGVGVLDELFAKMVATGGLYARYRNCLSSDWNNGIVTLQKITGTRYRKLEYIPTNREGAVASAALPPATACCLTRQAAIAGRGSVGTLHMPAVPNTFAEEGLTTVAADTAYGLLATQLAAVITLTAGGNFNPVIFHRPSPANSPFVALVALQETIRTMRRRVVGRGI